MLLYFFHTFLSIFSTLNIQRDVMIYTMNRCCNFTKYYVKRDIKNATFSNSRNLFMSNDPFKIAH